MTTLRVHNGNLEINIEGADKLWALKSQLTIPLAHISSVTHDPEIAKGWWHGFKAPGTNIPGVLTAGSYYEHKEWTFWDVHNPENTIVITLKDERYKKLVIEVENPQQAIAEINFGLGSCKN